MAALLPAEERCNRILVKNVPLKATNDKLIIHFQRKQNGGEGNVINVLFPKSEFELDQAVIEFDEARTAKNVLDHEHVLFDQTLTVSEYNEPAFTTTEAELSQGIVEFLRRYVQFDTKLREILQPTGAQVVSRSGRYILRGQFYQVRDASTAIEKFISELTAASGTPAKQGVRPKASDRDVHDSAIKVNQHVYAYWKKKYNSFLQSLMKKYGVKVVHEDMLLTFEPATEAVNSRYLLDSISAKSEFEKKYTKFFSTLKKAAYDIVLSLGAMDEDIETAMAIFCKKSKVYAWREENRVLFISSTEIEDDLEKQFHNVLLEVLTNDLIYSCKFDKTGLEIVVVHGDIKKERSDVLIAETNPRNLASEILQMAGSSVVGEIESLLKKGHSGLIKTTSGGLQCNSIIHYLPDAAKSKKLNLCDLLVTIYEWIDQKLRADTVTLPINCMGLDLKNKNEEIMNSIVKINGMMMARGGGNLRQIRILHPDKAESRKLAAYFTLLENKWVSESASNASSSGSTASEEPDVCAVCLDELTMGPKLKTLPCKHIFHQQCIDKALNFHKRCPTCMRSFGLIEGTQPVTGRMRQQISSVCLPGFPKCDTIVIEYNFPAGVQGPEHPHPGKRYSSTSRRAYLPNNEEGREVLLMLQKAFRHRLIFTVGRSVTTGQDDSITWNDIHHKTSISGGPSSFGYPDPSYLRRVKEELAAKGITSP